MKKPLVHDLSAMILLPVVRGVEVIEKIKPPLDMRNKRSEGGHSTD